MEWEKREEIRKKSNTKNSGLPKLLRWLHALPSDQFDVTGVVNIAPAWPSFAVNQ